MDGGLCLRPNDRTSWVSFISVAFDVGGNHYHQVGEKELMDKNIGLSRFKYAASAVI
jgi:hypothetical protein